MRGEIGQETSPPAPLGGQCDPRVGRRIRVWFLNEASGQPDYEYGAIAEVHSPEGPDQNVTIQWDTGDSEFLCLGEVWRIEWLGDDVAADLISNLKEHRQESVDGAKDAGAAGVTFSLEQLRQEMSALQWMRDEMATRSADVERLRRENEALKAQRREFHERVGGSVAASLAKTRGAPREAPEQGQGGPFV